MRRFLPRLGGRADGQTLKQARDKFITMLHASRTPENNPFHPGFGAVPQVWAGRDTVLALHARERRARVLGRYTRGAVFIGPSGIGKSVLVNRFAEESARSGDVVLDPIRIAKRSDPVAQLAGAVDKARRQIASDTLVDALERLASRLQVISVKGVRLAVKEDGISNPHVVVRDSVIAVAEHLAKENSRRTPARQRALVLRIDELQNADDGQRSHILAALGDVLEHQVLVNTQDGTGAAVTMHLPVLVYLSGLPDLINRRTEVDTFRRRFDTTPLGMLADSDVLDALVSQPLPGQITVSLAAAHRIAGIVAGDPYLFQLVGQHAWNASTSHEITGADAEQADRETYAARLRSVEAAAADIPPAELTVLEAVYAVAGSDLTVHGRDVAKHMGKTPAQIATSAQRLERRAVITRDWGEWRIENRLLHRYQTTGDII